VSGAPPLRRIAGLADAEVLFAGLSRWRREVLAVAYLDPNWRLLALRHCVGGRDHLALPIRAIVRDALTWGAARVIVAHNHPSGDAEPSDGDRAGTRHLAQLLRAIDVTLVDHLVIGADVVTSLRMRGAL
jgi:DNA repair protein RadC